MVEDNIKSALNFRKAVEEYADFIFEIQYPEEILIYDKERIKDVLDTDREFDNMDEFFWFVVSNYIHPDDLENVDRFRDVDIKRRLEQNEKYFEMEFRIKVKGGEYKWVHSVILSLIEDNNAYVLGLFKNINEKKLIELECTQLARKDAMTRLYNKTYVQHIITEELEKIVNDDTSAVMIVDIDNFKNVNDMYGHLIGDKVIIEFANRLLEVTREQDVVGRIGGDEFIVYTDNVDSKEVLERKLQRILSNLSFQFVDNGVNTHIYCSIGAVLCNSNMNDFTEAYRNADKSLYFAKNSGKNTYKIYEY